MIWALWLLSECGPICHLVFALCFGLCEGVIYRSISLAEILEYIARFLSGYRPQLMVPMSYTDPPFFSSRASKHHIMNPVTEEGLLLLHHVCRK